MEHRTLGHGPAVSAVAYGTWITHAGQLDEEQAHACVAAALDAGVTTFDTADFYAQGEAERVLGRALKGEPRDELFIATKVGKPMGRHRRTRAWGAPTSSRVAKPRCAVSASAT